MQPIRIIIARRSEYVPGDAFEVFGDRATGTVDFDHSLTARAVPLWLEAPPVAAHLLGGHLLGVHLDGVFPAGHLEGVHLSDTHLVPESVVVWESEPYVFGRFQHVLKMACWSAIVRPALGRRSPTRRTAPLGRRSDSRKPATTQ